MEDPYVEEWENEASEAERRQWRFERLVGDASFAYTDHCSERMRERGITREDVLRVLLDPERVDEAHTGGRRTVTGTTRDRKLCVVVAKKQGKKRAGVLSAFWDDEV